MSENTEIIEDKSNENVDKDSHIAIVIPRILTKSEVILGKLYELKMLGVCEFGQNDYGQYGFFCPYRRRLVVKAPLYERLKENEEVNVFYYDEIHKVNIDVSPIRKI